MNRLHVTAPSGRVSSSVPSPTRSAVVSALAAAVLVGGLVGAVLVSSTAETPATTLPLLVWVGAFLVAERFELRVHLGRHGYEVGAAEAVLALGLVLAEPGVLLASRLVSAAVVRWLVDRQRSVPLALNVGVAVTETVTALAVRDLVAPADLAWSGTAALGVMAGVTAGATVAALIVILTLTSSDGVARPLDLGLIAVVTVSLAAGGAGIGTLAADLLLTRPDRWWLVVPPAAIVVLLLIGYVRQRQRVAGLSHLLATTRAVHETSDPAVAVRRLVEEVRARFGGEIATLRRLPADGSEPTSVTDADPGIPAPTSFTAAPPPAGVAVLVGGSGPAHGTGDAMAVTVGVPDGGQVVLRVARVTEGAPPYRRADVEQFRELAIAAVVSLETSRMSEMLTRLREVDEMKTAFLTAVSHDLRTPLAVVRGGVETLLTHATRMTEDQLQLILSRMQAQGRRLDHMLLDLLDIDRLQRGVLVPIRERADVTELAVRVTQAIADTSHPIKVSPEQVTGTVDVGQVSRVLENLVRNAIKYTPAGTPIWVETRRDALGVQLVVADAGPGVPDDQKEAIFEAFVRGDDAHPSPGTGVGLDLVRRLAELHGGRAWVDDRPGGGARFWVTLPDPVEAPEGEATAAALASAGAVRG